MSDHVYKKIELVGSSPNSFDEAGFSAMGRGGTISASAAGNGGGFGVDDGAALQAIIAQQYPQ